MRVSLRFDKAITKLYNAFHSNQLNPDDCKACAVGNILDKTDSWRYFTDKHGSVRLNYVGLVNQNLGKRFNGYSPLELLQIEASFLRGCGYTGLNKGALIRPENCRDQDLLFNGLCQVVEVLCQLDGVPNVMNCAALFKFEKETQEACVN